VLIVLRENLQNKLKKDGPKHNLEILELIHTDICGPYNVKSIDGFSYFITFTNDYFRYGYIYPIREKSEALDKFKIFKTEVENQHELKIKEWNSSSVLNSL
jgi:hypothetical protein